MKKAFLLLFIILLTCGCQKEQANLKIKTIPPDEKKEESLPLYQDSNTTPIGIYQLNGNSLTKLTTITKKTVVEEDLGLFQVYPANDDTITLSNSFADSYYNKWLEYKQDTNLKLGFNIKFHLNNGENVSYNIMSPDDCMMRWEHLMTYLYDDYTNKGKNFYSHIESNEYNENTLFTAIKIQNGYKIEEIDSKIQLTAFTYDTDDDFDENNEYRGNSSYTFNICLEGRPC